MIKFSSTLNNEYFVFFKAAAILNLKDRSKQNLVKYTKSFKYVEFCVSSIKSTVGCVILENHFRMYDRHLEISHHIEF